MKLTILAIIIAMSLPSIVDASHYYTRGNEVTSGYYPPRIQQLCNDNFIGTDWNTSMKYEKRCRKLWTAWTEQIKNGTF